MSTNPHVLDANMDFIQSLRDKAQDAVFQLQSCLCQPAAKIKVNGRSFKIIKILGEGGFSFVYLAQDEQSGRQFALKKIRCPTGNDGVAEAMREVEAYRRFKHPNIIRILDSAVVQDRDGDGKIVYLFLPFYRRGNLQDVMNANAVNGTHFPEQEMVRHFHGTCLAVSAMHDYRASGSKSTQAAKPPSQKSTANRPASPEGNDDDDDDDDDRDQERLLPHPEEDIEGEGFSYGNAPSVPRAMQKRQQQTGEVVFDGDQELSVLERVAESSTDPNNSIPVPYAHRDIKPANVMISDEGHPILMDFGSTVKARVRIDTRQQGLAQQDLAAEQSTMSYRAPELFDVKTGTTLDEKVDIWSLGCMLFALAYGHSPFELNQNDQGGSIALAVMNAQYKHPAGSAYSQGMRDLIDVTLKADPADRPNIHQLIEQTERVIQSLN